MKPKKNPKADLSRRSLLFFQLGMVLMLFIAWRAIEHKTYDRSLDTDTLAVGDDLMEEVPITQQITPPPPPPPPPPAPEVIEVVEDEEEVEETIIKSTETDQKEDIIEVADIEESDIEEIDDVPFAVIENVPVYPGCENASGNNAKKACMSDMIDKFVKKEFNGDLAGDLGLEGIQKIFVRFKIDKTGNVVDVQARAPHPKLEQEAMRVIKKLPNMTPGKQRGKPVGVLYSLPIRFQVE